MANSGIDPGTPKQSNWIKFAERIGSTFPNLRDFVNSPSMSSLNKIRYTKAISLMVVGGVTSYVGYIFTRNQKEDNNTITGNEFKELVQTQLKKRWGNNDWQFDWSGVNFRPMEVNYTNLDAERQPTQSKVVYKTSLKNDSTLEDLEHKVRTELHRSTTCESFVYDGFVISEADIKLPTPKCMVGLGINNYISIKGKKKQKESKLVWSVEEIIKVPKQSVITVSMITTEQTYNFSFTSWVEVNGEVKGSIGKKQQSISIGSVFDKFPKGNHVIENGKVFTKIQGNIRFKRETDYKIETREEKYKKMV